MEAVTALTPMVWTYNGCEVFFDPQTEMGNLTTMWKACGSPGAKRPNDWIAGAQAQEIISALKTLITENSCILETRPGRYGGGTWTHWQIATVYAHYLDPHFYLWWNEQARAHIEGEFVLTPQKFDQYLTELGIEHCKIGKWNIDYADALFKVQKLRRQEPSFFGKKPQIALMLKETPVLDPRKAGRVYVFEVENKPGQYKIGSTQKTVASRARDGVGQTDDVFISIKEIETNDAEKLEHKLQSYYKKRQGKHIKKELFRLDEQDVKRLLGLTDYVDADRFNPKEHLDKVKQESLFDEQYFALTD